MRDWSSSRQAVRYAWDELAEEMGHSPQMTVMTYTHVIRELRGDPPLSAEEQIEQARARRRGPRWPLKWVRGTV